MPVGAGDLAFELICERNMGWPSNASALGASIPHPRLYPFGDQCPLKFSHRTDHLKHEPSSRSREIEIISQAYESDSTRFQFSQAVHKMSK